MNGLYYKIIPLLFLFSSISAFAVTLKWDIPVNERLEIVRTAKVRYLINKRAVKFYDERNIIDLTCYAKEGKSSRVKGLFSVYQRESGQEVFLLREKYHSDFLIEPLGRFHIHKKKYMPNLRHIPSFPNRNLEKGDKWNLQAELVLNNFSVPFKLSFPALYELTDIEKKNQREIAVINYSFIIDKNLSGGRYPKDFPIKILGKNKGTIYWDISRNCPVNIKEKYRIVFFFHSGLKGYGSTEFQMYIETKNRIYSAVTPEQKEKAKEELQKEIPEDSGIKVDTDKRGLVLRMGDVLFDFDSSELRKDTQKNLDNIIEILRKKYPDREIIVEGHTDDIGDRRYNHKLSKNRARSVAKYLKSKSGRDKLSYRGFGPDRPITNNSTKKGRQKNRRVEIIIKLN